MDVPFWSIYMGDREGEGIVIRAALERIDAVHELVRQHPNDLVLAGVDGCREPHFVTGIPRYRAATNTGRASSPEPALASGSASAVSLAWAAARASEMAERSAALWILNADSAMNPSPTKSRAAHAPSPIPSSAHLPKHHCRVSQ